MSRGRTASTLCGRLLSLDRQPSPCCTSDQVCRCRRQNSVSGSFGSLRARTFVTNESSVPLNHLASHRSFEIGLRYALSKDQFRPDSSTSTGVPREADARKKNQIIDANLLVSLYQLACLLPLRCHRNFNNTAHFTIHVCYLFDLRPILSSKTTTPSC